MDETLLSRIVNGFRQPSDELKVRIAEVLHSDIEWLFEAAHDGEQQRTSGQTGK